MSFLYNYMQWKNRLYSCRSNVIVLSTWGYDLVRHYLHIYRTMYCSMYSFNLMKKYMKKNIFDWSGYNSCDIRHESIVTQYRAMFVLNCKISEVEQRTQNPTRRKRGNSAIATSYQSTRNCDNLRQVSCAVCGTEVAVIDPDEVYHFHNVLPSFI